MAGRLFRNIWQVLNTDIELSWETVTGGVEAAKAVFELADTLQKNKDAAELKPIIDNLDSVLDVLNSPLGKVAKQSLPFLPIATSLLKYVVEQTRGEPTLADSVELVSQVAYLESLRQFLRDRPEIQLQDEKASEEVRKKIKKLGDKLEIDGREIEFNESEAENTLLCFHDSPLAKAYNQILEARLVESGLTAANLAATVTERISRDTHRYMKKAALEVKDDAKKLAAIYDKERQQDLAAYKSIDKYLDSIIADAPKEKVFAEDFVVRDIYVPLQVKPVDSDGEVDEDAEPENIQEWAKRILLDEGKRDRVLFVQAGPGRGKSVFCGMFGDLVRRELHPIYTPILIRLRDVTAFKADIDETLSAAVGWDFVKSDGGWLTDRNTRFLFLLDGFDELLLERGARYDLKVFLDQVAQFQKRAVENSERGHRVLITGRPLALYGIERLMPQNLERVSIVPMVDDIQERWLKQWQGLVDADEAVAADKIQKFRQFLRGDTCPEQVEELAREPLLLYLLAAMHRDERLQVEMFAGVDAPQAKVLVYDQALDWVLKKQRAQGGSDLNLELTELESEDLRALLAETGLCVVQSGREHAAISTIENRLREKKDEGAMKLIDDARKTGSDDGLKNALAAFYLKSAAGAENSVEFFHKSFGEFLCAERMAETMEEWTIPSSGKRRKKFAVSDEELNKQVYDLFGYGALTVEVVEYLMALLVKNEVDLVVLFERLHEFYLCWSDGEFVEATEDTLPQKKARQLQQQKIDRGQRQVDIYTGLNVMILLFELHRYGQSREEEKIAFHPCAKPEEEDLDKTRLLRIIGYSQCLEDTAFLDIAGKFLRGANLIRANLSGADLSGANLSGANLIRANLIRADLIRANLSGADLSGANLIRADLRGANLSGANLSGANLIRANLIRADLIRADLIRADLSGADLRDADLRDADLRGADLRDADLRDADLIRVDLRGADLIRADLSDINWNNDTAWSHAFNLHEAIEVPEALKQHPEFAAAVVLSRGYSQVREGEVDEAIRAYQEAQTINPQLEISARFWNILCWRGCLHHRAADVLFAGEKAVEQGPDNGHYKDTRGLARALTGDIEGAIKDFQAALDTAVFDYNDPGKEKRQRWLEALQADENPFTPDELAQLRGDEL